MTTHADDERAAEPSGTIAIEHGDVRPIVIDAGRGPGTHRRTPGARRDGRARGGLTVRGAAELRVKESDRIGALVAGLRALGAEAEEYPDGFAIAGGHRLSGAVVDAAGDHRLAMAFAIAALGADGSDRDRGRGSRLGVLSRVLRGAGGTLPVKADKIYLVGFMAAGKSSLARELGRRLDWRVEDVDERIEAAGAHAACLDLRHPR